MDDLAFVSRVDRFVDDGSAYGREDSVKRIEQVWDITPDLPQGKTPHCKGFVCTKRKYSFLQVHCKIRTALRRTPSPSLEEYLLWY